jgi:hypothetical protein
MLKRNLWAGELWEEGYITQDVGGRMTREDHRPAALPIHVADICQRRGGRSNQKMVFYKRSFHTVGSRWLFHNYAGRRESTMVKQTIALFLMAVILLRPSYGEGNSMQSWKKYFFDGQAFREGTIFSGPSVYQREGYLPMIQTGKEALREDKLPPGTGGVVIFCYIQSAGGKLQNHGGYIPLAGAAVEIGNGTRMMVLRTDAEGYSVIALPAGKYELRLQGVGRKVRVETGKTTFVMVRTGKRMVD